MNKKGHVVAIVSGGLDSVSMAYHLADKGYGLSLISYDYGQRHKKEIEFAQLCAQHLNAEHHIVDLTVLTSLMNTSSLTSPDVEVPDGHYAEETMKITVVPNRNAIMINIATALAVSRKHDFVATGVHGGDHFIYPDCRPEFIASQSETLRLSNAGFISDSFEVLAPFVNISKGDIVTLGEKIGVPWIETWSCYKGGDTHCGSCGTCFERREAFEIAGVADPTVYAATPRFSDPR
jgi:7-cyano-7-deazaguanine synthase